MRISTHGLLGFFAFLAASCVATFATARTNTLRIVTYNIEADTPGIETPGWTTPRPGLIQPADASGNAVGTTSQGGVLEAIGQLPIGTSNNNQPLDILVLQETTSNTLTIDPIVSAMNTYYGVAGMYARSPVQGSNSGGAGNADFGNGPNALVYNTQKMSLIASVGVGTVFGSSTGEYRQVMRYEFRPAGGVAADDFYIYVSHYKSGGGSTNQNARLGEANIIRNNAALLPSNSRIIYAGDYNVSTSTEDSYQRILDTSQINAGIDPLNTAGSGGIDWTANSNNIKKTDNSTSLNVRYDFLIATSNVANFNPTGSGLQLIPNTYQTFANNGSTAYHGATDSAGNTALDAMVQVGSTSFISASTAKNDLQFSSDHLPVMADFSLGPGISIWNGAGSTSNWNTSQDWDSAPIDGDSLQFAGSTRLTNSNNSLSVVGAITFNSGAGTFTLSGNAVTNYGGITNNSTNAQNVNFNQTMGAAQQFNAASGNISVGGSVANGGNTLTIAGSSNVTLGSTVSGAGGLIKNGVGVVILNGTNSYTGGTTITAGTAQLGNAAGLGSSNSTTTINGGTLDLHGFSAAVGGLNGSGGAVQTNVGGAATLSVGGSLGTGAYSGQIQNGSGTVALIKTGAGTQTLSGNNSYSGGTTVAGGTLQLGHANALGSNSAGVTVNSATLDLHGFSPTIGALNGSGGNVLSNIGTAAITVGNGGGTGSYPGTISNGSGSLGLIKTGIGTQTLSGNNSYSGGTTVAGGTLQLGHASAMGSSSAGVTVNSGTVDLHGFSPTIGALNGSGGAIQTNVAGAVALTIGNGGAGGSFAGTIQNNSGTVSTIKTGAGTQTLTGNNSYSGGTTVTTGTLIAGHVNALGTGGLTINNTATAKLQAGLSGPVQLPSLAIAGGVSPTATLDITDNNLILHNGNLATTTAQIANGFLGGGSLWTGSGITSSSAQGEDDSPLHAVGVILNNDSQLGGGGDPIYSSWPTGADSGSAVTSVATDVLAKYTYFGDADLDGQVDNSNDYGLWLNGYANNLSGWLFGDFDYSGSVDNSSDYGLWLNAFANQGAPLVGGGGVQPVPEPSTLVLAALGLAGVGAARIRRRRAN